MKPGTELPWELDDFLADLQMERISDQDAAYIVHAANMYPKLVEALSLAKANLDARAETRRKWTMNDQANWERIDALLRECEE
jgi:hypothetical protein